MKLESSRFSFLVWLDSGSGIQYDFFFSLYLCFFFYFFFLFFLYSVYYIMGQSGRVNPTRPV
jgi:hypothetical protein